MTMRGIGQLDNVQERKGSKTFTFIFCWLYQRGFYDIMASSSLNHKPIYVNISKALKFFAIWREILLFILSKKIEVPWHEILSNSHGK